MIEPVDILDKMTQVRNSMEKTSPYPGWFNAWAKAFPGHGCWIRLLNEALAEIERLRAPSPELEQMRQLNGRLLRRLADGDGDVAYIEQMGLDR